MSAIELKEKLMEKINGIDDEALLHEIADFIDFDVDNDDIYKLSPEEVEAVKDGIDQIQKALAISNEEARKIFDNAQETGRKTDFKMGRIKIILHNKVYYRIHPEKIEILAIWDSRRKPKKFKL